MIDRLTLKNFKSFDEGPHQLDLARLTLIYGPNSAGKSSIIQAIGMMKQTLSSYDPHEESRPMLRLRGEEVDLGDFITVVHGKQTDRELSVELHFAGNETAPYGLGLGFKHDDRSHGKPKPSSVTLARDKTSLEFEPDPDAPNRYIISPRQLENLRQLVMIDSEDGEIFPPREEGDELDRVRLPAIGAILEQKVENKQNLLFQGNGMMPQLPSPGTLDDELSNEIDFAEWFTRRVLKFIRNIDDDIAKLTYLGPMRQPPTRFQELNDSFSTRVGKSGENVANILRDFDKRKVDAWLEYLRVPYSVDVESLNVQGADVVTTVLTDTRSPEQIKVSPQDVGYGFSQLLPIVVQLLAAEPGSTILIEQPEVHIHPRLQARLGDLLMYAAERGVQVIVETHSEAIMLRIQGRLRERAKQGEGYGFDLSNKDISVWYIDSGENGKSEPQDLALGVSGKFLDAWPDGFFADRSTEVLADSFEDLTSLRADHT